MQRLFRRLPLSKHGVESARVQQLPAAALTHFKQILTQLTFVDGFVQIPRPLQRLQHYAIQAEPFVVRVSGVVIIHAQSARRRETCGKTGGNTNTEAAK